MSGPDIDPVEVRNRVVALADDDDHVHGVVIAGEGDDTFYAIAVIERSHEGETYLNERYVMLPKEGVGMDDTFMKNGINRRYAPGLARRLSEVYGSVNDRRNRDGDKHPRLGIVNHFDTTVIHTDDIDNPSEAGGGE